MSVRGYAAVGLYSPKNPLNVGSACRAAACFGAALIVLQGKRFRAASSDTGKAYRHLPLVEAADMFSVIPYACVPVAVEIVPGAVPLPDYKHPERAIYIFGPEDGSLPAHVIERCRDVVSIPAGCLNLAAATNIVLYDRAAKRGALPSFMAGGRIDESTIGKESLCHVFAP